MGGRADFQRLERKFPSIGRKGYKISRHGKSCGAAMNDLKLIEPLILTLRGQRVILDADLAGVGGVSIKRFNEPLQPLRAPPEDLPKKQIGFDSHE
jgi:hypothetical protein